MDYDAKSGWMSGRVRGAKVVGFIAHRASGNFIDNHTPERGTAVELVL